MRCALVLPTVLASLAAFPSLAGAATITVNTTVDNAPTPGQCEGAADDCSLRQAIDVANGEPGADSIVLPAGNYALTIAPVRPDDNDTGDLDVSGELAIEGAGARKSVIDASAIADRVLNLETPGKLRLVDLAVTGGRTAHGGGGGIRASTSSELSLLRVALTDNTAELSTTGGGIEAVEDTKVEIVDSVLSGNRTSELGGAIYAESAAEVKIENSTLADNLVDTELYPGSAGREARGGAIYGFLNDLVTLRNDTIAGNQIKNVGGIEEGGGGAALSLRSNNTVEVANTIVAENTATRVLLSGQCDETVGSLGHNLETEEEAGEPPCFDEPTDLVDDPLLGALADNGGETDTMALGAGSPAIAAADPALCPATDQRGELRPTEVPCDIGAYEDDPLPPPTPPPPQPSDRSSDQTTPKAGEPAPASGWFGIKKIGRDTKAGTAQLAIDFTGSGEATLTGKGVKPVSAQVATGMSSLAVVPTGTLKTRLAQTGKAKATVTISFRTAANTWTKAKTFFLRVGG
jgi:hypothetical protein